MTPPATPDTASSDSLAGVDIFELAKANFLRRLKDPDQGRVISQCLSVHEVVKEINAVLDKSRGGTVRNLGRIRPYLDALAQFSSVIEVFIQVKPDLLSLIWGPIKLVIQFSSSAWNALDKIVDVLGEMGRSLPQFHRYAKLFAENDEIKKAMGLFYEDILELHLTILNFFKRKKWNLFFECFWPRTAGKISLIQNHMKQLSQSLAGEVKFEDAYRAHAAQELAYEEYFKDHDFQDQLRFEACQTSLAPRLYDEDLGNICRDLNDHSCWLRDAPELTTWINSQDLATRSLWLQGIPGAGKTVLAAKLIQSMLTEKRKLYFAFFSYADAENGTCIRFFQSLMFQLLFNEPELRPVVLEAYKHEYRKLKGDINFVLGILKDLIISPTDTYLAVDGLDELEMSEQGHILKHLLALLRDCPNLHFFLSSRMEKNIVEILLPARITTVRVDHNNSRDIEAYVRHESDQIINCLKLYGADDASCEHIMDLLGRVAFKAQGMFLYAKLMMGIMSEIDNPPDMEEEISRLPDGLEQAYGRVMSRIKNMKRPKERETARKILHWVGCARTPLREEELLQALAIDYQSTDFSKGLKVFRDVCKTCGPIIEIKEEVVQFVHFTVQEYLFGPQSGCYLTMAEANLEASLTTTAYLSFASIEQAISKPSPEEQALESTVRTQILSGCFVFFSYAAQEMITHVRNYRAVAEEAPLEILNNLLFMLTSKYETYAASTTHNRGAFDYSSRSANPLQTTAEESSVARSRSGINLGDRYLEFGESPIPSSPNLSALNIPPPLSPRATRSPLHFDAPGQQFSYNYNEPYSNDQAKDCDWAKEDSDWAKEDWTLPAAPCENSEPGDHLYRQSKVEEFLQRADYFLSSLRMARLPARLPNERGPRAISMILSAQGRIQKLLEELLCPTENHRLGCFCPQLKRLYGTKLFRCGYLHCPAFRDGFESASERNAHLATHSAYSMDPRGLEAAYAGDDKDDDDNDDHPDDRHRVGLVERPPPIPSLLAPGRPSREEMAYSTLATTTVPSGRR